MCEHWNGSKGEGAGAVQLADNHVMLQMKYVSYMDEHRQF